MNKAVVLDVRDMPPRERHPKIFKAWEALPVGGALKLVNDHDPKPLFYEFRAERGGEFEWTPLERGPETWSVEIKRIAAAAPESGKTAAPPADRPSWAAKAPASVVDVREDLRAGGEPFPKILAAAMQTQPGDVFVLRAIFDPKPLYEVLRTRGFEAWPERLAEDDWKVYFHKKVTAQLPSTENSPPRGGRIPDALPHGEGVGSVGGGPEQLRKKQEGGCGGHGHG